MTGRLVNIAALIGAITTIGGFAIVIVKAVVPLVRSINRIADDISTSEDRNIAIQLILKDLLSMRSTLIIQRGWHTPTEESMLRQGLETYTRFGQNGQVKVKVEAALLTELRVDKYYTMAQEELEKSERVDDN